MRSSSWRLIREDGQPTPTGQPEAPASPQLASIGSGDESNVLRGQSRSSIHGSNRSGASQGQMAMPTIAAPGATAEQVILAEEISQIERAAEERGYEIGRNRAEAELRAAVEGASALADKIQAVAPERTSEIAHSIAELALSVARRIIQHEVRIDPSLLCASLEAAVSTINGSPEAHVLLNPASVAAVSEAWEALHGRAYLGKKWLFEGDPTLPVGGCTLRYEHGFVEAGLESQLEEIGIALDRAIPNLARGSVEEEVA